MAAFCGKIVRYSYYFLGGILAGEEREKPPALQQGAFRVFVFVRRERKSHKEVWFLWMMLYYPAKLSES